MTEILAQNLFSVGGYVFSLLLGIIIFFIKREMGTLDKERVSQDVRIASLESAQREKWDKHAEKHSDESARVDGKREQVSDAVQALRSQFLENCADTNDRFLTKDEFTSSTMYLTKKTDEVARLLQSIENILAQRR